jgi:hypothetical protein
VKERRIEMNEQINNEKIKKQKNKKTTQKREKKQRGNGFNFVDAIIIICIASVLVLMYFVYSPLELLGIGTKEVNIIYTVKISGVPSEYATAINPGDTLFDRDGYSLGTVAAEVEIEPYSIYEYKENEFGSGGIINITHPDLVNLIITVSAEAEKGKDGYEVDDKRIAVEAEYEIMLPKFESKGLCISLSEEIAGERGAQ